MSGAMAWFRLDLRRRWRSLLVLALLIVLAAGTVLTSVAGARRGATAVDRLLAETLPAALAVLPNQPGFDWEPVRAMPGVEALATIVISGFKTDGRPVGSNFIPPPGDADLMWSIERPVVLDGRLADPNRPDEAVVTQAFVDTYGKGVGDSVRFELFAPEQVPESYGDGPADGPVIDAAIVGVIRSPWFGDSLDTLGTAIPSAGLYTTYEDNFLGADRSWAFLNALVRLDGGEAAIPEFTARLAELTGSSDIEYWNLAEQAREIDRAARFEANSLLAFAVAAGIAAVFLVGQSIARYSASTVADLAVLRALGMSPRQSEVAAVLGPGLAAVAGTLLAAAAAVVASRWFPIGTATLAEPQPGLDVDWPVLVAGLVGVPLLVVLAASLAATFALRATRRDTTPRRSVVTAATGRLGLPTPIVVGTQFALEPGRGRSSVPVRPALLGAITGVLGVLAAFTFSSGVDDALATPARWGLTYDVVVDTQSPDALAAVADVPGVTGVNNTRVAVAESAGRTVTVISVEPVGAPLEFVMTDGRPVEGDGEVALGMRTAALLGMEVGDAVQLAGESGTAELTVVGVGFVPHVTHNDRTSGALVTGADYEGMFDTDRAHGGLVALGSGADPDAVLAEIASAAAAVPGGDDAWVMPADLPNEVAQLRQSRALPVLLAGFLTVLAVGAVGHALATAVRRRRHDVAVLRALGMTRTQSRAVVVTQASVLALVGLAFGLPLGIALGRVVWRYVADVTPLFYVPPVALLALALIVPAALLVANLLAVWPGQRAASMRVGHVLRAE
jgi:ABC-type lipoprotein release transport system permease subunit